MVVKFMASWCTSCRKIQPAFEVKFDLFSSWYYMFTKSTGFHDPSKLAELKMLVVVA